MEKEGIDDNLVQQTKQGYPGQTKLTLKTLIGLWNFHLKTEIIPPSNNHKKRRVSQLNTFEFLAGLAASFKFLTLLLIQKSFHLPECLFFPKLKKAHLR